MSTPIETTVLSGDLVSAPDNIWTAEAITTAPITSGEFILGQTMAGVEIKVKAAAAMTIVDGETVTMEVQTSATSGGTFVTYSAHSVTGATGNTVLAAGDTLVTAVMDRELSGEIYTKIVLTPDTTSLASSVDADLVFIS